MMRTCKQGNNKQNLNKLKWLVRNGLDATFVESDGQKRKQCCKIKSEETKMYPKVPNRITREEKLVWSGDITLPHSTIKHL